MSTGEGAMSTGEGAMSTGGTAVSNDGIESYRADVTAVDAAAIERELARLWREAAESSQQAPEEERRALTRACRWNLVVVTDDLGACGTAQQQVAELSVAVPTRSIMLALEQPDSLEREIGAAIATHCHLAGHGKQVCSEQVLLTARGSGVEDVPSVVLALLLADLPAAVYWQGYLAPLAEGRGYARRLVRNVERLIIDSGNEPGVSRLGALLGSLRNERNGLVLVDLSWLRLAPWRSLAAHAFDGIFQALLRDLAEVRVTYAVPQPRGAEPPPPQPLLFVGWLMSRLGWKAKSVTSRGTGEGWAWTLQRSDGGEVSVAIGQRRRDPREVTPGGLIEVELGAERAGGGRVQLVRTGSGQAVTVMRSIGTTLASPHVASLPAESTPALLGRALTSPMAVGDAAQMRLALAAATTLDGV